MAATSMNWEGNVMVPAAREMVTRALLQGLAHGLQHAALELRQFVEEKHAMMRQGNFARRGIHIAAEQARRRWRYDAACGKGRRVTSAWPGLSRPTML